MQWSVASRYRWATEYQYETKDADSEDDKKLRQAENRALRAIKDKRRFQPFKSTRSTGTILDAPSTAGSQQQGFLGNMEARETTGKGGNPNYMTFFPQQNSRTFEEKLPIVQFRKSI